MSTIADRLAEIEAAPEGPKTVAFFDFDGTIIDGYSASAMLKYRAQHGDLGPLEFARLAMKYVEVSTGRADFDDFMRTGVKAFAGTPAQDIERLGEKLLRSALGGALFPESWALVAAHKERGHRVVLATSALPFQVEPLAAELGVDDVLCTRLTQRDGVLTGEVDGPILWGAGKADAVQGWARSKRVSLKRSFAYGNGEEDVEYLSLAGHPRPVNADPGLAAAAAERGWPVTPFERPAGAGVQEMVRTVASYGSMAVAFAGGVGMSLLNRRRQEGVNLTMGVGSDVALAVAGVRLNVTGAEHLWSVRPAVFIFNHQSWLDGLIMMKLLREDVTGVAKAEVADQPGFGQFARFANMAFVDRANGAKAKEALAPVVQRLREGYSIVLAPEGTRSTTPRVLAFKKGAFHMAMQGEVPIVPIVIRNAGELLWRGSTFMKPGTVDVHVLEPVPTDGWTAADLDVHVTAVRQSFVDTLAHWPSSGRMTNPPPGGDAPVRPVNRFAYSMARVEGVIALDRRVENLEAMSERRITDAIKQMTAGGLRDIEPSWLEFLRSRVQVAAFVAEGTRRALASAQARCTDPGTAGSLAVQAMMYERQSQSVILYAMDLSRQLGDMPIEAARADWETNPAWAPAREQLAQIGRLDDWREIVVALNLCFEPIAGQYLRREFGSSAAAAANDTVTPVVAEAGQVEWDWVQRFTADLVSALIDDGVEVDAWAARHTPPAVASATAMRRIGDGHSWEQALEDGLAAVLADQRTLVEEAGLHPVQNEGREFTT